MFLIIFLYKPKLFTYFNKTKLQPEFVSPSLYAFFALIPIVNLRSLIFRRMPLDWLPSFLISSFFIYTRFFQKLKQTLKQGLGVLQCVPLSLLQ
jgi:hypothetical protein